MNVFNIGWAGTCLVKAVAKKHPVARDCMWVVAIAASREDRALFAAALKPDGKSVLQGSMVMLDSL